jgi:phosphate transport system permease protein
MEKTKKALAEDGFMTVLFYAVAGFSLLLLLAFLIYVIVKGFSGLTPEMMTFTRNGILNQFFNTVYLVFISLLISAPFGILAGIYLAEYAKKGKVTEIINICIETLSSLPSIVVGLFGYIVFILLTHSRFNLMAGALAVSVLSMPVLITTTTSALLALPSDYALGSMALGATHWQTIRKILIPASTPRIITGVILAAGRGFGEAAALLFTAGMSTNLNWGNWDLTSSTCPLNPFRYGETLSLLIWSSFSEATASNAKGIANLASAVLVIMVLLFNLGARFISGRLDKKFYGGKRG